MDVYSGIKNPTYYDNHEFGSKYIAFLILLSLIFGIIWVCMFYCLRKNSRKYTLEDQNKPFPSEPRKLDLKCNFLFNGPALPARYFCQHYDVPTSTRTILDDELEALNKNVEYTTVNKKKVTFRRINNVETEAEIQSDCNV